MTKAELVKLFPAFSPKRAFEHVGEGVWQVVGKHVQVQWITNTWDVYLRTGRKRCNRLVSTVPGGVFCKVVDDGEAWWQSKDVKLVRAWLEDNRVALGIAKRRVVAKNPFLAFKTCAPGHLARFIDQGSGCVLNVGSDGLYGPPNAGSAAAIASLSPQATPQPAPCDGVIATCKRR